LSAMDVERDPTHRVDRPVRLGEITNLDGRSVGDGHGCRDYLRSYWSRRTTAGSIRAARRAGSQDASPATAIKTTAAPASVRGSRGSRLYNSVARKREAQTLRALPAATPPPTRRAIRPVARRAMDDGAAPSAMRMPNSRRRR